MRLVAKRHVLQPALERAFSVAAKTPVMGPELQSVFCTASENRVELIGSDTELTLVSMVGQVDVEEPGELLMPPRIRDIVRLCHDSDVVLEADAETIKVTNDATNWIVRLETGKYPMVSWRFEPEDALRLGKEILGSALSRVRPAVASDENREDYKYVQVEDGRMRGTDGRKFIQVEFPSAFTALLPLRAVQEIIRRMRVMALPDVQVCVSERNFVFRFDDDFLIVLRHNVNYPNLDANLLGPALMNDTPVALDRRATLEAVRRVAVNADPDTNYMTVELVEDALVLTTLDKMGNQSNERLDVNWPNGRRLLGVHHGLLADMLSAMSAPSVTLWLGEDDTRRDRRSFLRFDEEGFVGVLQQLRQDLGEAAKGSDRVRPAQQAPVGWGHKGVTAENTTVRRAKRLAAEAEDEQENREFYMDTDEQFDFNAMVER